MSGTVHIVCPSCSSTNSVPAERLGEQPKCGKCRAQLFSRRPLELRAVSFRKHISHSQIPVLVDFWAAWCGPCKIMAPVMEQAAARLEPHIRVAKVNTEEEQALASSFAIRSIPTVILFRGGAEIARRSGALQLNDLTTWVESVLR